MKKGGFEVLSHKNYLQLEIGCISVDGRFD